MREERNINFFLFFFFFPSKNYSFKQIKFILEASKMGECGGIKSQYSICTWWKLY